jgi:hypothetical protein
VRDDATRALPMRSDPESLGLSSVLSMATVSHPIAADCPKTFQIGGGQSRQRGKATVPSCSGTMCAFPDRRFPQRAARLCRPDACTSWPDHPRGVSLVPVYGSLVSSRTQHLPLLPPCPCRLRKGCFVLLFSEVEQASRKYGDGRHCETHEHPFVSTSPYVFVHFCEILLIAVSGPAHGYHLGILPPPDYAPASGEPHMPYS